MALIINKRFLFSISTALFLLGPVDTTDAYHLTRRWLRTATDGAGLSLGDPTTLTWSIVPDGTNIPGEGLSDLIVDFDNAFAEPNAGSPDLTNRLWWSKLDQSFQRWGDLSGNTYVYEPSDDGVAHNTFVGVLGVRGDVRIAGNFIDGNSGVLAYNFFPDSGDMVLDTGDVNFFSTASQDYRRLRNTVMHEHGHGIALNHIESNDSNFLMEPFLSTSFDGPQLDDVRGIHRGYGDQYEKNGGNDTASTATDMGSFGNGDSFKIGTNGRLKRVPIGGTDFVSIDDNLDADYFSFNLTGDSSVTIDLTPVGPTYSIAPLGNIQNPLNASAISDLTLALIDTNQSTVLASSNIGGVGVAEQIADFSLGTGQFYIHVTGTANNIQMYELEMNVVASMVIDGDFNDDGFWTCADINALTAITAAGSNDLDFDLTGDGVVDFDDVEAWLVEGGAENPAVTGGNPFIIGDANLDGFADGLDFILWNNQKFTSATDWCTGNFNGDPVTDGQDFIAWNDHKFTGSDSLTAVPEPSSTCMLMAILGCLGLLRRR